MNKLIKKDVGLSFFFLGLLASILLGVMLAKVSIINYEPNKAVLLISTIIISGLVAGLLNIDNKKLNNFLLASTSLLIASIIFTTAINSLILIYETKGIDSSLLQLIKGTLYAISLFVASAVIFPALKRTIYLLE